MEEEPPTPPTPAPPSSPFWLHRRRRPSSFLLNSAFQVTLLSISFLLLLTVAAPSLISLSRQLLRPASVKRGWDSLNLLLVLFAVLCGFLGRRDGEDRNGGAQSPVVRTPQSGRADDRYGWFGNDGSGLRLRSFKSYPDLRQEMLWDDENDRRVIRSYDDSYVGTCKSPKRNFNTLQSFGSQRIDEEKDESGIKNIEVDTVRTPEKQESPPPQPEQATPPQSTPDLPPARAGRDGRRRRELEPRVARSASPVRRTRPAPPQEAVEEGEGGLEGSRSRKIRKKRGGVAKEMISSFYQQSKRKKKQKSKSHDNLSEFVQTPNPSLRSPPPPPPPPHQSKFQDIFSTKKTRSSKKAPPPPPPPPPRRTTASHSTSTRPRSFNLSSGNGSESPSIPIPPPPPPPPFKIPAWKFVIEGDYAKIMSSPRTESEESATSTPVAAGNTLSPLFCPSPDVNTKADNFIARFKAKLQLEKINSLKQKQEMGVGFSPLGPDSSPNPT